MITKKEEKQLEGVIKLALMTIFGDEYRNYNNALMLAKMKSLKERRDEASIKFAADALNHPKWKQWFCQVSKAKETRSVPKLVKEVPCRTERYKKSPIPALVRVINKNAERIKEINKKPECNECGSKFINENNLLMHIQVKHPEHEEKSQNDNKENLCSVGVGTPQQIGTPQHLHIYLCKFGWLRS